MKSWHRQKRKIYQLENTLEDVIEKAMCDANRAEIAERECELLRHQARQLYSELEQYKMELEELQIQLIRYQEA